MTQWVRGFLGPRVRLHLCVFIVASGLLYWWLGPGDRPMRARLPSLFSYLSKSGEPIVWTKDGLVALPAAYQANIYQAEGQGVCSDRYGSQYIRKFSASATNHCDNTSTSTLTCFTHEAHESRVDSFCMGVSATVDPSSRSVSLDCSTRPWTDEDSAKGAMELRHFPSYWYNTGPDVIFNQYIHTKGEQETPVVSGDSKRNYLLVKREPTIENLWHTLMQISSLSLSLDILRTTLTPGTQTPLFTTQDAKMSQVIILDDFDDGPFFELWNMFGDIPAARLQAIPNPGTGKVVVPLPGGSNPIWGGDWVELHCEHSAIINALVNRILDFYDIPHSPPERATLTLTLIDRRNQRLLDNQDHLFAVLQKTFPTVKVQLVDFAQLPFREQVETVRKTDILVGVHGAGLTHELFLPSNSSVVEILPPTCDYKGFSNMANFLGHRYFAGKGREQDYTGITGDWHADTVFIDEDKLVQLVEKAVAVAIS
ncbi:hypothetical protein LTR50_001092 [Elasticomyces elasticus]|nr:hypothetical protein LTR50_001092 [Elasticomyces elasticus]